jgi:hypothetical protein
VEEGVPQIQGSSGLIGQQSILRFHHWSSSNLFFIVVFWFNVATFALPTAFPFCNALLSFD